MARPKLEINPDHVREMAAIGCRTVEIAQVLGCSTDTIEGRFSAELNKGRSEGKTKLRRLQWASAENGNATILIWLGKQLLGQREPEPLSSMEGADDAVIKLKLTDDKT